MASTKGKINDTELNVLYKKSYGMLSCDLKDHHILLGSIKKGNDVIRIYEDKHCKEEDARYRHTNSADDEYWDRLQGRSKNKR